MRPRRRKLALDDKDTKLVVRVVDAPESPADDLAAARRALRLLARWLVAQAREAKDPSQACQDPPDSAPQSPSPKVLDFQASKRTPVSR